MEQELKLEKATEKNANLNEAQWRAHIETSEEYTGTNRDYLKTVA
jgi:hypothetical protein